VNMLREAGIEVRVRIKKACPPPLDRINAQRHALCEDDGTHHVRVHPDCERLIEDWCEVQYDESGRNVDKSDSTLTHAAEAVGFWFEWDRPVILKKAPTPRGRVIT
ncbi:hypothetical protein LCGC14_2830040, partial [marine sediment metagenome]